MRELLLRPDKPNHIFPVKNFQEGQLVIEERPDLCILVTVEPGGTLGYICTGYVMGPQGYEKIEGKGIQPGYAIADAKEQVRKILNINGVIHG